MLAALGAVGPALLLQIGALLLQGLEMLEGRCMAVAGPLLQKGEAGFQLLDPLAVLLQPRRDRGHGAPQFARPLVERLRLSYLITARLRQTEQRIALLLQLIAVLHLIQQLLLVLELLAFAVELLLEPLPQLMLPLQHVPAAQALLVINGQG